MGHVITAHRKLEERVLGTKVLLFVSKHVNKQYPVLNRWGRWVAAGGRWGLVVVGGGVN